MEGAAVCEEPLEVEFESGSETNSEAQGNATLFLDRSFPGRQERRNQDDRRVTRSYD